MALYHYQALNKAGQKISGSIDAPSLFTARAQLTNMGLYPIDISSGKEEGGGFRIKDMFERKVSIKELILFTKQLAVLLKSGVPLLQSMELLTDQFDGKLRAIIVNLKDGIKEGKSLAQEMNNYPKVFDTIYVQLVRAGEASGQLETILERLTQFLERRAEIRRKVKGALQYPMIQLGIIGLIVVFLLTFVVPQMAQTLGDNLPLPTKIVLGLSTFITNNYIILIIGLVAMVVGFKYWKSTPTGALTLDKIKLRLPLIRYFTRTNAVVQCSQTLGMLLESGVNLSEALDIVVNIVDNQVLTDALKKARDKIIKQGKIAPFLKETGVFPPIAIYLIKTGEESGQLDAMLLTVAQNYEIELSEMTDGLAKQIEPLMLVIMALVVGFVVMSVVLPIVQQTQQAGL
ncbi:MAG: type II secretion system F family protein [Candidatus Babeliales bacterium]